MNRRRFRQLIERDLSALLDGRKPIDRVQAPDPARYMAEAQIRARWNTPFVPREEILRAAAAGKIKFIVRETGTERIGTPSDRLHLSTMSPHRPIPNRYRFCCADLSNTRLGPPPDTERVVRKAAEAERDRQSAILVAAQQALAAEITGHAGTAEHLQIAEAKAQTQRSGLKSGPEKKKEAAAEKQRSLLEGFKASGSSHPGKWASARVRGTTNAELHGYKPTSASKILRRLTKTE